MAARKADHPLQRNEKRAGARLCYLPSATPPTGTRSTVVLICYSTSIEQRDGSVIVAVKMSAIVITRPKGVGRLTAPNSAIPIRQRRCPH